MLQLPAAQGWVVPRQGKKGYIILRKQNGISGNKSLNGIVQLVCGQG